MGSERMPKKIYLNLNPCPVFPFFCILIVVALILNTVSCTTKKMQPANAPMLPNKPEGLPMRTIEKSVFSMNISNGGEPAIKWAEPAARESIAPDS